MKPCIHRRDVVRLAACDSCGKAKGKSPAPSLKVFGCDLHGECTPSTKLADVACCKRCPDRLPIIEPAANGKRYVTAAHYMRDLQHLASLVPHEVTAIAGVPRSGMFPASWLAMQLHLPLYSIHKDSGLQPMDCGWRMKHTDEADGTLLIVDDTTASGTSARWLAPQRRALTRKTLHAVVYAAPESKELVDLFAVELPIPHYLEWNLFNSVYSPLMALDFDGVLCEDCPAPYDDDAEHYQQFLVNARPLYLSRRCDIPLIVTARLEKYRPQTEAWLERYGIKCNRLVMGPWDSVEERRANYNCGAYKGAIYRDSDCTIFVESCPVQSREIAIASGKTVICPTTAEVWN